MTLKVAIQMDPIGPINIDADSTFRIAEEAQARGHSLFYFTPDKLAFNAGRVTARGWPLTVRREKGNHFSLGEEVEVDLSTFDVVWLRQDPPFDMGYITTTHLLDMIKDTTLVVNDPFWVRNYPEKLLVLQFQDLTPPTMVARDLDTLRSFRAEHGDVILKPLYGNGGAGVFKLVQGDGNLASLHELFAGINREPLIMQKFLPAVSKGDKRVNSVTFWVCVLDPRMEDSDVGVLVTKRGIEMARKRSAKKGVLAGSDLSRVFAWLRPNDLVWNYVVNNYLHGQKPPAFDVLYWNNDSTNLTAALHSDYLSLYETQPFANPGKEMILGEPIDLGKVDIDAFIVGGVTDHITPWKACYRTTQMLGGKREFVLSNSGHIQAILNPPGNPKAKYFANDSLPATADEWAAGASEVHGSWWERWAKWLDQRSGETQPAPKKLGSRKYKPMDAAPGTYVLG